MFAFENMYLNEKKIRAVHAHDMFVKVVLVSGEVLCISTELSPTQAMDWFYQKLVHAGFTCFTIMTEQIKATIVADKVDYVDTARGIVHFYAPETGGQLPKALRYLEETSIKCIKAWKGKL